MKLTYIASCSMGKDSLAMLLMLLSKPRHQYPLDYVVFYDSGMEFDCIYRIRDKVKDLCRIHGVQFVELFPKKPFLYSMLERKVVERNGQGYHYGYSWCGGRCRWATTHKLNAIRDFKASLGCDVIDYVGIAFDEQERIPIQRPVGKRYPLVDDWNMSESDCLSYCRSMGWEWLEPCEFVEGGWIDLYEILDRVSCWCCANKNQKELYNIYRYLPQYWQRLRYLQSQTDRPMKGYYKGKPVGVYELEKKFKRGEFMSQFIGIYNPTAHKQWLLRTKNHKPDVLTAAQMERRKGYPVVRYANNYDQEYPYTLVCSGEGVDYGIPKEAATHYVKVGIYDFAADTFAPEEFSRFDGAPVYMEDCPYANNGVIWDEENRRYYDGIHEEAINRK